MRAWSCLWFQPPGEEPPQAGGPARSDPRALQGRGVCPHQPPAPPDPGGRRGPPPGGGGDAQPPHEGPASRRHGLGGPWEVGDLSSHGCVFMRSD